MNHDKDNIVFLDTNVLSDIGRCDEKTIRTIALQIAAEKKFLVVVTPFHILEIEKIPDSAVKKSIYYFLNIINTVLMKDMNELFYEEILSCTNGFPVNPIKFQLSPIKKSKDGNIMSFSTLLDNLLSSADYVETCSDHLELLEKLQAKLMEKLPVNESDFVYAIMEERIKATHLEQMIKKIDELIPLCPSCLSYAYSLYDKIGSKGLRKKAGEMNDTAMSYIFPYVGTVITEKRQANILYRLKADKIISALEDTRILKHSDVFKEQKFYLKTLEELCI